MMQRTRAPWFLGALAMTWIHCSSDQKTPANEAPMPPPAEPPAEVSAAGPAAKEAQEPSASTAGDVGTKHDNDAKSQSDKSTADAPATLDDAQIAAIMDVANTGEIEQAKLARGKSKNAEVQKFAAMMIAHHGEAKQKLAKLKITPADNAKSTKMLEDGQQVLSTLKESSASDFDARYFDTQVDGHQKVLDAINNELIPNAKSAQLKAYLEEVRPKVEQHLAAARKAQQAIEAKAGARGAGSTSMK